MAPTSLSSILLRSPTGTETTLASIPTYIAGHNPDHAILYIHDILGWQNHNARILCDYYATEVDATVYLPDFFRGQALAPADIPQLDPHAFRAQHDKPITWPLILECALELRQKYAKVGVVGYCFGGWSGLELGSSSHFSSNGHPLIDCLSIAYPACVVKSEIDNISVPVQIMAPEFDDMFNAELKAHANSVIPTKGIAYEYCHFEGAVHRFASQPDFSEPEQGGEERKFERPRKVGDGERERKSWERAQRSLVRWMREWLVEV